MPDETIARTPIGPWEYVWGGVPRPFVHPVSTPAGHVVSLDAPDDHWWHHALWFTIKFVDGENFWEEYDEFGLLVQSEPPSITSTDDDGLRAESRIDWQRPGGAGTAVRETCVMEHRRLGGDAYAMDWDVRLTPATDVTFDRTPFTTWGGYGGLTLRGRRDWHDTVLRLPDGEARARVLGERAEWCSLDGPLGGEAGDAEVGVAMFDHPGNPGHPIPWYASTKADTYGDEGWSNFLNAAFLWDGPIQVAAGDELRLRHRFIAHDGRWSLDRLHDEWQAWRSGADTP